MATTQNDRAVISLVINGEQAKASLKEISLATTRLRSEVLKMKEADNPELYRQKVKELNAMNAAYRAQMSTLSQVTTAWQRFKKEMGTVAVGVVGGNVMTWGLQQFASLVPDTINRTMKLRDAFADIEKATGLSSQKVKELNRELKNIDTRTSNDDLRSIAVVGGQLGIANAELVDFVKNTDMAVVALGDEFKGGAEEVGKVFGGIAKLYKETKTMNIGKAINDIGSAVNELGADGAATGPVIAEFVTRIGQMGDLAPSLTMSLALGASFQELGLTAEIAASGLTGLLSTAAKESDLFGQQLRMSKKELEALINTKPDEFIRQLAASFKGMTATQVQQQLAALKVESQESAKVMSILANNTTLVESKFRLTAKAMAEGSSLAKEAAARNHQLAKDLKDLNEWFSGLLTSEGLQNFLVKAVHNTLEFTRVLSRLGPWLKENQEYLYLFAAATVAYYGATIKATLATVANTAAETYRKVAYEAGFRWLIISEAATKAYAFTTGVLTGQISLQTAAVTIARGVWTGFNAILAANPIGAVVAAMTALVFIVKRSSEHAEQNLAIAREQARIQFELKREIINHSRAQDELNKKVSTYNDLSAQEQANTKKSIALKMAEASARLANLKARARELALQAAGNEPTAWEKLKYDAENFFKFKQGSRRGAIFEIQRQKMNEAYSGAMAGSDELQREIDGYKEFQKQLEVFDRMKSGGGVVTPPTIKDKDKKGNAKTQAEKDADSLEKMLEDARQRIMEGEKTDYEKQVAAFAEKYSKMYELAKTDETKITEIRRLSLLEWGNIEKKYNEEQAEKKQQELSTRLSEAEQELELERQLRAREIQRMLDDGKLTQEQARTGELNNEEIYLEAKKLLYSGHYKALEELFQGFADKEKSIAEKRKKDLGKIDKEIQQNQNEKGAQQSKNAQETNQQQKDLISQKDKEKEKQLELALTYKETGQMAAEALKSTFQEHTVAYKAAIAAQKAFAIAEVIINLQRQIALINAQASTYMANPAQGAAIRTAQATAARIQAGVAIAAIAAAGARELSAKGTQLNPNTPTKAIGGYTDINTLRMDTSGSPSGFVSDPTYFALGSRSYVAGEAGQEFIINNRALQSPVVASFARMINAVQQSGHYSALSGGSAAQGSGPAAVPADQSAVLAEMRAMNRQMRDMSSAVIYAVNESNNYFRLKKRDERVEEIRKGSSL
ncbi:hypothetical protein [Arsenicibacter rosenii]|uniref:Phage tail tape measure protein n=1 Tax=Arsenicibacter rosenii TaxID=1750698 RepID=A0A1S2VFY8_9BACT|nr:hypothetical protein [Arsenicibacter rosenii]OIN57619.1 hypothetical protein BLX24_19270 [Arsenicibacter rosenii]